MKRIPGWSEGFVKTAMKPFFLSEAPRGKERPQKPKVVANRVPGKQTKIEV